MLYLQQLSLFIDGSFFECVSHAALKVTASRGATTLDKIYISVKKNAEGELTLYAELNTCIIERIFWRIFGYDYKKAAKIIKTKQFRFSNHSFLIQQRFVDPLLNNLNLLTSASPANSVQRKILSNIHDTVSTTALLEE